MANLVRIRTKVAVAAVTLSLAMGATLAGPSGARAGDGDYIGQIIMFAGQFCPQYYVECNGALLSIQQNTALFSLLGTAFGGNGQTTFAVPDLRGRVPMGYGAGPGLTPRSVGQSGGTEYETLTTPQIPQHNHTATISQPASSAAATKGTPAGNIPAVPERSIAVYSDVAADVTMRAPTINVGLAGAGQPHNNMPPYVTIRYCICTMGIYPSRP